MTDASPRFSPLAFLRAVVDHPGLTASAKLTGLVLLRFADADGRAHPVQPTLATRADCSVSTIRRNLRGLEAAQLVVTDYAKGTGLRTRLARYTLRAPLTGERSLTHEAPLTGERSPEKAPLTGDQRLRSPVIDRTVLRELPKSGPAPRPERTAPVQDTPREKIWTLGVTILTGAGRNEPAARALLGRLIRDHGEEAVAGALGAAATKADPAAYLSGILRRRQRQANGSAVLLTFEEELAVRGAAP